MRGQGDFSANGGTDSSDVFPFGKSSALEDESLVSLRFGASSATQGYTNEHKETTKGHFPWIILFLKQLKCEDSM